MTPGTRPRRPDPRRRLVWLALLLLVVVAYGVIGYMAIEGWGFLDALYMTVTTLATVGFREVRPLDAGGMVLTMSIIVLGVGLVLITITITASLISEGEFGARGRRRRMQRRIDDMRDHYIVCAYGRVGRAVARELEDEGVAFVVLDLKEELEERMQADGVVYWIGDPSLESVLRAAGVERAKGLVCAVDSDATNVYITLTARSINPELFIVARASEPGSPERLRRAGADRVVSPFVSSGRHMAMMALRPTVVDVLELAAVGRTSLELEELLVESDSPLVGRTAAEAVPSATVLVVRRASGEVAANPDPSTRIQDGDVLLLLGSVGAARAVTGASGPRPSGPD